MRWIILRSHHMFQYTTKNVIYYLLIFKCIIYSSHVLSSVLTKAIGQTGHITGYVILNNLLGSILQVQYHMIYDKKSGIAAYHRLKYDEHAK